MMVMVTMVMVTRMIMMTKVIMLKMKIRIHGHWQGQGWKSLSRNLMML